MTYNSSSAQLSPAFELATLGVVDKEAVASDNIDSEKQGKTTQNETSIISQFANEDEALAYLADVLVEAYLVQRRK